MSSITIIRPLVLTKRPWSKLVAGLKYSSSPQILLKFTPHLFRLNIIFHGEVNDTLRLTVMGEERLYKRMHVLEFDSRRKRMSVIYQFPDGSIRLVCKGAESSVLPRCIDGPVDQTLSHIDDYALVNCPPTFPYASYHLTARWCPFSWVYEH